MFTDSKIKYNKETSRSINPSETFKNVKNKIKIAGITRITEITDLDRVGIPVYSAIRPTAQEGSISIYAGKGTNNIQAKVSAIMESFERYSAEYKTKNSTITGNYNKLKNCIDPKTLILPKKSINIHEQQLEWTKAVDINTNEKVLIPSNAVYHPYNINQTMQIFKANTNGLASGNIIEESVIQGINELIERDSWSIFEFHKEKINIDLDSIRNELVLELLNKFKTNNIDIKLIDLTSNIKIPTIAAISDDLLLKDPALLTLGIGTHLDPNIAIIRALTEVAQSRATQIHGTREDSVRADFMRKAGYERMKKINKHWFSESENLKSVNKLKNYSSNSFQKEINTISKLLESQNLNQILMVDLTKPEINIPVVKMIVPGLEVFALDPERVGKRLY